MAITENNKYQMFLGNIVEENRPFVLLNGGEESLVDGLLAEIKKRNVPFVVYDYKQEDLFAPYAPWLSRVIEALKKMPETSRYRVYREQKIYYALVQILEATLQTGTPCRLEPLIEEEVWYETSEFIEDIYKLYLSLVVGNTPCVVVLQNLQMAPSSSLAFLQVLATKTFKLLQVYGIVMPEKKVMDPAVNDLIALCRERSQLFDFLGGSEEEDEKRECVLRTLSERDPTSFLAIQHSFLVWNAIRDAYTLGVYCIDDIEVEHWDEKSQMLLAWYTGKAASILKEYNEAAHYLNMAFVLMDKVKVSLSDRVLLYRDMAFVFYMKDALSDALSLLDKAFHLVGGDQDKKSYFEAFFLYFQIEDKNRKQQPRPWKEIYEKIIALATDLNYENHLALIYINPYGIYSEYASDVDKYNTLILNEKGISLARKLRNTYRLSHGYQIRGLIYAVMGQYDQVITWYRRSLVLKKRMGLPLEIAYGYNGVGFYYYMTGRYGEAHRYYTEALGYLFSLKDFHEIAMTYFNMGMNCLLALDEKHARIFFEEVVKLIEILEMNGLAYHSLFGIYAVLGTTYALQGEWTLAYDCVNRIRTKKLLPYLEKNEEYFFIAMLLGLLAFHEKKDQDMVQRFREANYYLHRTNDNIGYMIPWYCLISSQMYAKVSNEELSLQMWKDGIRQSEMRDSPFYKSLFAQRREERYSPFFEVGEMPHFSSLRELAKAEHKVSEIYRQMQDVHVLNILQQDFIESSHPKELVQRTLEKLVEHFLIDFACFVESVHGIWQVVFHAGIDLPCEDVHGFIREMGVSSQERLFRCDEKSEVNWRIGESLASLVVLPLSWDDHQGLLFCGTQQGNTMLSREDLKVLRLIAQQMALSLQRLVYLEEIERQKKELEEAYHRLEEMALHDSLTGAMNRMALQQRLGQEMERIKRYGGEPENRFSLIFLDMDNFKAINDTYGHAMGDKVLSLCGRYLQAKLRKVDLVFRYGGDEFVILLPETPGEKALHLGSRIQQEIPPQVAEVLGIDIMPTFSLGIVEYGGEREMLDDQLLQMADQALYEAKKQGKNCCVLKS
ncbi:MAG: diguanylate cyclase [Brevinematales bacterium]|nr:diguanylate cyclase [Brevinematales bacterium]